MRLTHYLYQATIPIFYALFLILPLSQAQTMPAEGKLVHDRVVTFLREREASPEELQEKFSPELLALFEGELLPSLTNLEAIATDGSVKVKEAPINLGFIFTDEPLLEALNDHISDTGYTFERIVFPTDTPNGQVAAMMMSSRGGSYSTSEIPPTEVLSASLPGEDWYVTFGEMSASGVFPSVTGERWELYVVRFVWWEPN